MKRNILIYGAIAGLIVSISIAYTAIQCYNNQDFSGNMWLGYTFMLAAFAFVFVGVKNYRDQINGGSITFAKAFKLGILTTLFASTIYVVTWLIAYYLFIPDFMDKYTAHVINDAKASGLSAAALQQKIIEMDNFKVMYKSPVLVVLFTYMEIFPVGLLVSIVSALILKKRV